MGLLTFCSVFSLAPLHLVWLDIEYVVIWEYEYEQSELFKTLVWLHQSLVTDLGTLHTASVGLFPHFHFPVLSCQSSMYFLIRMFPKFLDFPHFYPFHFLSSKWFHLQTFPQFPFSKKQLFNPPKSCPHSMIFLT